ncbi:MAG: transketolase C-terminal domain-containing protein [Bacteroidales bacterium]|jgi:transketolase
MRKEFAQHIERLAVENDKIIFLTGDLGFMALENLRKAIGDRFINTGVSEQNMISMAASLAYENLIPVCYSIAPFIVFRPAEQIRIDVCLHNLNVKIVGNGGGFGYGIMGATHHAIEDIAVIGSFQNMRCFIPFCNEDVSGAIDKMFEYKGPSYLRLGFGDKPQQIQLEKFSSVRRLSMGDKITIAGIGPILLNVFETLAETEKGIADVFAISEMPLTSLHEELKNSITKTKKLLVIEEHVKRGGLGENIASLILEDGICCVYRHLFINGYVNGLYGSQSYHLEINGLDKKTIFLAINTLING